MRRRPEPRRIHKSCFSLCTACVGEEALIKKALEDLKKTAEDYLGEKVEQAAGSLGLRRSNLSVAMASEMGIPCAEEPDCASVVLILWNTERRPIFAYQTPGRAIELSAKVLQPAIHPGGMAPNG